MHRMDAKSVLGGERDERGGAKHAERLAGLEVGLDPCGGGTGPVTAARGSAVCQRMTADTCATARVRACDREHNRSG